MMTPMYGLKGAPRAWRKESHQVLAQRMSRRQLHSEPEPYCVHKGNQIDKKDAIARAKEHDREQQEASDPRTIKDKLYKFGNVECLLPVHVDDVKGTARRQAAEFLFAHFNRLVGQCKADYGSALHADIKHEHSPGVVLTHQHVYIDSITPISAESLVGKGEESFCCVVFYESYRSVLGAVACTVLIRAELAASVQA